MLQCLNPSRLPTDVIAIDQFLFRARNSVSMYMFFIVVSIKYAAQVCTSSHTFLVKFETIVAYLSFLYRTKIQFIHAKHMMLRRSFPRFAHTGTAEYHQYIMISVCDSSKSAILE